MTTLKKEEFISHFFTLLVGGVTGGVVGVAIGLGCIVVEYRRHSEVDVTCEIIPF
jgi:NADH:ubiquinone oxidoreductase subunit K